MSTKPLKKNTKLGRFEILSGIGKGGMGEVYLAKDTKLDRNVAIKVLPSNLTDDEERLLRFEREAKAVSSLNHPHILTIFEFGESDEGLHFMAAEHVEGTTLSDFIIEHQRLDLSKALDIAKQVASALSAAHEAGIAHRDIKPDNIMVRPDGYIKVLDFGLAKLTEAPEVPGVDSEATTKPLFNTSPGSIVGTAAYMSPEQARGHQVDTRTDLWSLGVVIYEMVSGHKPFRGETSTDTIISVIQKEPPPITSYIANVPSDLVWIISKALTKDLDGRYQTAKELSADLEKIRKRVEFESEAERSTPPEFGNKDDSSIPETELFERMPTSPGEPEVTQQEEIHHSSLEVAARKVSRNKGLSALIAIILTGTISAAAYFYYLSYADSSRIRSIAVLPFENGSEDRSLAYLSDGLSESLIDRLSELPQLKVIARTSSFKFRGTDIDVKDVGTRLGVRAIVMGRVLQRGNDLMIRVDVIDANEDKQIWGETYNRKANDLISIQNEIAKQVSDKLSLRLTGDQEKRLAKGGTDNPEAYRYYLNGLVDLRGKQDVRGKALELFEKAVELDPDFALAHVEIAFIYLTRAEISGDPSKLLPKAKAATKKALEIDDKLAKAYAAQAAIKEYEFDWSGADSGYKRAVALNPNSDFARSRYAFFLSVVDRHDEALAEIKEAESRDPVNKRTTLLFKANILAQARRYDEAIQAFEDADKLDGSGNTTNFQLGLAYFGKGELEEAEKYFSEAVRIMGGEEKYSQPLVYLGAVYARTAGKREQALEILKRLEETDEYVSPSIIAVLYTALGDKDKAFEALEKAFDEKDLLLRYIGVGFEYDDLRQDPRFKELLKKTGLSK